MKRLSVYTIVFLSILFIDCRRERICPGFPDELNYFPYYKNQKLNFVNSQQDIRCFTIFLVENTTDSESFGGGICSDSYSQFETSINQELLQMRSMIYFSRGNPVFTILIDFCFNKEYLKEILYKGKEIPIEEVCKYLNDTISVEKEDNKIIKKVIIAKGKGVISYTTADGEEWNLVE